MIQNFFLVEQVSRLFCGTLKSPATKPASKSLLKFTAHAQLFLSRRDRILAHIVWSNLPES